MWSSEPSAFNYITMSHTVRGPTFGELRRKGGVKEREGSQEKVGQTWKRWMEKFNESEIFEPMPVFQRILRKARRQTPK
ncbi:hypothetical protein E2C01_100437 [Portunus trituberculatus]|uniref:Uncharacterized protein n=1 Tax=Portunus trituberculatus TaxID=210409 RepID=A0A5B7K308_PORTR|nr:hypothetical protein [Portunus trituberculatus]